MSANLASVNPITVGRNQLRTVTPSKRSQTFQSMAVPEFRAWLLSRWQHGESLGTIARSFAVHPNAVHRWIHGDRSPSGRTLLLASFLARYSQVIE